MTRREEQDMGQVLRIDSGAQPSFSLELSPDTTRDQWCNIGRRMSLASQAMQWQIGDWWVFGVRKFGEEIAKSDAIDIWGVQAETARVYGWVAEKFTPVRRLTNLSFSHFQEAAALPTDQAEPLLARAQREHLSTRDLRREVSALKIANDPEPRARDVIEIERPQKAQAQPLEQRELITAYEMVIEFADALRQHRDLTRRENDMLSVAMAYLGEAHADRRPCPEDFDVIFTEQGRLECEAWYRASRITVNRWLIERGKRRLILARAAFVKHQRDAGLKPPPIPAQNIVVGPAVDLEVARLAADFLRTPRAGGWPISPTGQGDWWVGTTRKSAADMVAFAERKGFDAEAATAEQRQRDYIRGQLG